MKKPPFGGQSTTNWLCSIRGGSFITHIVGLSYTIGEKMSSIFSPFFPFSQETSFLGKKALKTRYFEGKNRNN
jgi:hypothetical protein